MKASMKKKRGVVGAVVLAGILSVGGFALTNTVTFAQDTTAGLGQNAVTQVAVTDMGFKLNDEDKSLVDEVKLNFNAISVGTAGAEAWFRANSTDGLWYKCADVANGGLTTTCDTTAATGEVQTGGTAVDLAVRDIAESAVPVDVDGTSSVAGTLANVTFVIAEIEPA